MTENRESELLNDVPDGLFIGGEWRPASEGGRLEVHDPATGEVIKEIADATVADGRAAIDAAVADAFPGWAATPPASGPSSCAGRSTCCSSARRTSRC